MAKTKINYLWSVRFQAIELNCRTLMCNSKQKNVKKISPVWKIWFLFAHAKDEETYVTSKATYWFSSSYPPRCHVYKQWHSSEITSISRTVYHLFYFCFISCYSFFEKNLSYIFGYKLRSLYKCFLFAGTKETNNNKFYQFINLKKRRTKKWNDFLH